MLVETTNFSTAKSLTHLEASPQFGKNIGDAPIQDIGQGKVAEEAPNEVMSFDVLKAKYDQANSANKHLVEQLVFLRF